jgi:hypothetical protein
MIAAMGLDHPSQLTPDHVVKRISHTVVQTYRETYSPWAPNQLLDGNAPERFQFLWDVASPDQFHPPVPAPRR